MQMQKVLLVILLSLLVYAAWALPGSDRQSPSVAAGIRPAPAYEFIGGHWFTGDSFESGVRYAIEGVWSDRRPTRVDSTVDLQDGYVVPPFGDAHSHNLDGTFNFAEVSAAYLREGTFYVQVLTNTRSGAAEVRDRINQPDALDVTYANGGLTSTFGAPMMHFEPRAMGLYDPSQWAMRFEEICRSRLLEGDGYWFIDTAEDLDAKWPGVLAGEPDLVKVYLLDSSKYEPIPSCDQLQNRGLDPALLEDIVRRADEAGLRVAAHVETATDFTTAVEAGVAIIAHLPGYRLGRDEDPAPYQISEASARLAGDRDVAVTPTLWASEFIAADDSVRLRQMRDLHRHNLRLLIDEGVDIAAGGDLYGLTARTEVETLRRLGIWDNLDLLTLWAVTTPSVIYPGRQIGRLKPGYEASFLVLGCDPVKSFECVDDIRFRFKQGEFIQIE